MPKMKTNRAAAKRFKLTGTGKLKRRHCGKRHLNYDKAPKRKRRLRESGLVAACDVKRIKRVLALA